MNKIWKFIEDWIWQLPQNLCGLVWLLFIKNRVITTNDLGLFRLYLTETGGGVTLGKYVFINQSYTDISKVILHESGHVDQSRILGPLYLPIIGIQSIIHAALHSKLSNKEYYHFWTEKWANMLAKFNKV